MEKRGSHVGIILLFVVFILFVSFLFVVFKPSIKVQQNKELALEYLEKELVNLSTGKLASVAVYVDTYDPEAVNCFRIEHPNNFGTYGYAVVKEGANNLIGSSNSVNLEFDVLANQHFFKIYYSNEKLNNEDLIGVDCEPLIEGSYQVGQISTKEYIFESKVVNLIEELKTNETFYSEVQSIINNEFDFGFTDFEGTPIWTNEVRDVSTNIYIKKIPVQYIDEQANIKSGYLNLRIW
ncbi:MAG: hypothetical protein KJ566_00710 [Nanoarchaeota archaeon]|nr:hypothetical protein [Nanoarchaeota archaeon]